jgi:hypothetical protein
LAVADDVAVDCRRLLRSLPWSSPWSRHLRSECLLEELGFVDELADDRLDEEREVLVVVFGAGAAAGAAAAGAETAAAADTVPAGALGAVDVGASAVVERASPRVCAVVRPGRDVDCRRAVTRRLGRLEAAAMAWLVPVAGTAPRASMRVPAGIRTKTVDPNPPVASGDTCAEESGEAAASGSSC